MRRHSELANRQRNPSCLAAESPLPTSRSWVKLAADGGIETMNRWFRSAAKRIFLRTLAELRGGYLELVCPDQTHAFGNPGASLRAMAVVHDERFFQRALTGADVGIGESYMDGDWTSPDLVALVRLAVRNLRLFDARNHMLSGLRQLAGRVRHRLRSNSLWGSRRNIRAHYDLGNAFYRLFLDRQLVYSCAHFRRPEDTLDLAQEQKLDLVCRKLMLRPGERVLEIGCGWGAFALHAARTYGVHVTALTISRAQYDYVADLLSHTDTAPGSVRLLLEDYRRVAGPFDKIVSIEMFEAVGLDRYDEFFRACDRLLAPEGSMLLQTITIPDHELSAYRRRVDWIQTYIFPGSELASPGEILRSLARATQLFLVDMESIGAHYALTLAAWRARFLRNLDAVRRLGFEERFLRMWDFYLAWCEGSFRERYTNDVQLLLAKNGTQRPLFGDPCFDDAALPAARLSARAGT